MGHSVSACQQCGSWVMEGCSCDHCVDNHAHLKVKALAERKASILKAIKKLEGLIGKKKEKPQHQGELALRKRQLAELQNQI
jgi:hypothetical protein